MDSQDILNAPDINFGTFQMFPDQFNYGTTGTVADVQAPNSNFDNTLNDTVAWIRAQIDSVHTWVSPLPTADPSNLGSPFYSTGKPVVLSAFGLVTQDNLLYFVPVNDTYPVVNPQKRKDQKRSSCCTTSTFVLKFVIRRFNLGQDFGTFSSGVTQEQINTAYSTWSGLYCFATRHTKCRPLMTMQLLSRVVSVDCFNTRLVAILTSFVMMIDISLCWLLQWSSQDLLPANGTFVQSSTDSALGTFGISPNDGYGILGFVTLPSRDIGVTHLTNDR